MFIKNFYGQILDCEKIEKGRGDFFKPDLVERDNFYYWVAQKDGRTCFDCDDLNGKIFSKYENPELMRLLHPRCRCIKFALDGVKAGNATNNGRNGADWWLKYCGKLPDYYITKEELERLGWKYCERPSKFVSDKMLTMGVYENRGGILPEKRGRIWYEADINYTPGRRNLHRVVWSNDGLIFVTYDHYGTFYEFF